MKGQQRYNKGYSKSRRRGTADVNISQNKEHQQIAQQSNNLVTGRAADLSGYFGNDSGLRVSSQRKAGLSQGRKELNTRRISQQTPKHTESRINTQRFRGPESIVPGS